MSLRKRLRPRLLVVYALGGVLIAYASPTPLAIALGLVPVLAGESLRIWATGHLHKNDALTFTGPYAYLRNPMYLGTLLIAAGLAVIASSPAAYLVLGAFLIGYFGYYIPYKERIEGARLEALYGDRYRRYAAAVPSLLPRLHPYVPLAPDAAPAPEFGLRFADNHELGSALAVISLVGLLVVRWALL